MILAIGKRNMCVEMRKYQKFKDLKNVQIQCKKNDKGGHRNL